jgi:DNA-binding transcriptional ArsR family regulator
MSIDDDLQTVSVLTDEMRRLALMIKLKGQQRREVMRRLRDNKVTFARIANAMRVSEQAVYADLRKDNN